MSNTFATLWTVAHQAPLSMGFPRQEYLSGLPFPSPGNLPNPGIEPGSPVSPALAHRFFTTEQEGSFNWLGSGPMIIPEPNMTAKISMCKNTATLLWITCYSIERVEGKEVVSPKEGGIILRRRKSFLADKQ